MTDDNQTALRAARDAFAYGGAFGAPFLWVFGLGWVAVGYITRAYDLSPYNGAIAVYVAGGLMPLAFLTQRFVFGLPIDNKNFLTPLAIYLAMTQALMLPVVFLVHYLRSEYVAMAMSTVVGAHFLPYVWLNGARLYLPLAIILSAGSIALVILYGPESRYIIPYATGGVLIFGAVVLTVQWLMARR